MARRSEGAEKVLSGGEAPPRRPRWAARRGFHLAGILGLTLAAACDPTIASVTPDPARPGDPITISGSGFGSTQGGSLATYDGAPLAVASWSDAAILATLPSVKPDGTYAVRVRLANGAWASRAHTISTGEGTHYDDCADPTSHAFDVPILANDGANRTIVRDPAVTGFLVPFAREEAVLSLNGLVVRDAEGMRLPAQFEALSRWGGGPDECARPIRFAYAHVRSTPAPGAIAWWRVRHEPGAPAEQTPLWIEESASAWVVGTGPARFTIRRDRFEGLSKVEVANGGGYMTAADAGEPAGAAGFLLDHDGVVTSTAHRAPWRLEIERRGPQVVTIAARGFYAPADGSRDLAYTVRIHLTAGSSAARIEHTYYHGAVAGFGAGEANNVTGIGRAWMRLPLAFAPAEVRARADATVRAFPSLAQAVRVEQRKRTPASPAIAYEIEGGGGIVETGERARSPFLAVLGAGAHAVATIARMSEREPQGLRFDPAAPSLDIDFTSTPIQVGGARGIWSVAVVDFGLGSPSPSDLAARADRIRLHAERPLLGTPEVSYSNGTRTIGPYSTDPTGLHARYHDLVSTIHAGTRDYLDTYRVTGLQIWPDMPRYSCIAFGTCEQDAVELYGGGDNDYWNWLKPGLDEFFRTGRNDLAYDFSLGEATTFVETLAFRTDHDRLGDNGLTGMAPCYGPSTVWGGPYVEGLNNRQDACIGDYTYNKGLKLAYLATADRRFVDFFEEAGLASAARLDTQPEPGAYNETDLSRFGEQSLENVADGAEFARDPAAGDLLRSKLRSFVDSMLAGVLLDGHHCTVLGTGTNDTRDLGSCTSSQGWMMPVGVEWATRVGRFLGDARLLDWVALHGTRAAQGHTALDASGLPDYSRRNEPPAGDPTKGWRTVYSCAAGPGGVDGATCTKLTTLENDGYFWNGDLLAFLNVFGLVLAADPTDPNEVCAWLPSAYASHLATLGAGDLNDFFWGKPSGLALAMAAETVGALTLCQ